MKRILFLIMMLALLAPFDVIAQTYSLAPSNTTIHFKVRNLGIMHVKGTFDKFKGTADVDVNDLTKSKIDVSIETTSINTGINKRDNHLRSADFFDASKFPIMKFVATTVEKVGADKLKITGNLTIKEITKPVVLIAEGTPAGSKESPSDLLRGATASATVNRQDFGVSWGAVIGDEVSITINTKLIKQ
jgi:polyisoprenoid-binding protein YceI